MKTIIKSVLTLLAGSTLLICCKQVDSQSEVQAIAEASGANSPLGNSKVMSATDTLKKMADNRKIIRTADFKFKVVDVAKSTVFIENSVKQFGGLVTSSDLHSDISERSETNVGGDSVLVSTKYTVANNITIRVPNTQLDSVVKSIAAQVDFLDVRVIKADDVSLQLLSNQLSQNRSSNQQKRMENAIDNKGKKLNQIVDAEEKLAAKSELRDSAQLGNLALENQIAYSTINLKIYQQETLKKEMIASLVMPRPTIGVQFSEALQTGWYVLEVILTFVLQLWSLILLTIVGIIVYKKLLSKTKPAI